MAKGKRAKRSSYALAVNRAIHNARGKRRHYVRTQLSDGELERFENYRRERGLTQAQALRVLIVLAFTFHSKPKHQDGAADPRTYEEAGRR